MWSLKHIYLSSVLNLNKTTIRNSIIRNQTFFLFFLSILKIITISKKHTRNNDYKINKLKTNLKSLTLISNLLFSFLYIFVRQKPKNLKHEHVFW